MEIAVHVLVWIAIGLGLGLVPVLPGTAGAMLGVPIAYCASRMAVRKQIALSLCLALIAVPICHRAEAEWGGGDPSRIVADEFLTFPVATLALPAAKHPAILPAVFVVSRVFDSLKLPPASRAEALGGGPGMVLDDVVANLQTLVVCWAVGGVFFRRVDRSPTPPESR